MIRQRERPGDLRMLLGLSVPSMMPHMAGEGSAKLDIVPTWANLNDMLIELVDFVPDERMDWSPKPELWTIRHLFLHLNEAREQWMNRGINDGETDIEIKIEVAPVPETDFTTYLRSLQEFDPELLVATGEYFW